jgi:hypothetical protein
MRNVSSYTLSKYTKKPSLQIGFKIVIYESTSDLWDYTTLRHSGYIEVIHGGVISMSMCRYMTLPQLPVVQPRVDIVEYAMCKYLYRYLTLCMLIDIVINVE